MFQMLDLIGITSNLGMFNILVCLHHLMGNIVKCIIAIGNSVLIMGARIYDQFSEKIGCLCY